MKKIILIGSLIATFFVAGCSKPLENSPYQDIPKNDNVELTVKEMSFDELVLVVTNHSDIEYSYGVQVELGVKEDGIWKQVPFIDEFGWIEIAYLLMPNQSNTETWPLKTYYGTLHKGEYRAIKHIYGDGNELVLAVEFTIE